VHLSGRRFYWLSNRGITAGCPGKLPLQCLATACDRYSILYSSSGLAKTLGKDKVAVIDEVSVPMEIVTQLLQARLAMNP
ncbi:MAG TPA: hypothetical protein VFW40_03140, partial [Capsulimonadaceae bacterium]|nr:hypothetical protein [Capsulimonadaceae bacterium]